MYSPTIYVHVHVCSTQMNIDGGIAVVDEPREVDNDSSHGTNELFYTPTSQG